MYSPFAGTISNRYESGCGTFAARIYIRLASLSMPLLPQSMSGRSGLNVLHQCGPAMANFRVRVSPWIIYLAACLRHNCCSLQYITCKLRISPVLTSGRPAFWCLSACLGRVVHVFGLYFLILLAVVVSPALVAQNSQPHPLRHLQRRPPLLQVRQQRQRPRLHRPLSPTSIPTPAPTDDDWFLPSWVSVTPNSGLYPGGIHKITTPFPITQLSGIELRWKDLQTGSLRYNWAPIDSMMNN